VLVLGRAASLEGGGEAKVKGKGELGGLASVVATEGKETVDVVCLSLVVVVVMMVEEGEGAWATSVLEDDASKEGVSTGVLAEVAFFARARARLF